MTLDAAAWLRIGSQPAIKQACKECGNSFLARRFDIKRNRAKFCGPICRSKAGGRAVRKGRYKPAKNIGFRDQAQRITRRAIHFGSLKRQPCEKCGQIKGIHAHHADYRKPLNIKWLCAKHHMEEHWSVPASTDWRMR